MTEVWKTLFNMIEYVIIFYTIQMSNIEQLYVISIYFIYIGIFSLSHCVRGLFPLFLPCVLSCFLFFYYYFLLPLIYFCSAVFVVYPIYTIYIYNLYNCFYFFYYFVSTHSTHNSII